MDDERYRQLIEWHRATQVKLAIIIMLFGIFTAVVLMPFLQSIGLVAGGAIG